VEEGEEALSVVLRLRTLYRKSVEYRLAHALFETKFRKVRIALSFLHLVLSSVTGAALFLGVPAAVTGTLSVTLTGLNAALKVLNIAAIEAAHCQGRVHFAGHQRSFATVLTMNTHAEIVEDYPELAAQFLATELDAPRLGGLELMKGPDGKPLFALVTTSALLAEQVKDLDIPEVPELPEAPVDPAAGGGMIPAAWTKRFEGLFGKATAAAPPLPQGAPSRVDAETGQLELAGPMPKTTGTPKTKEVGGAMKRPPKTANVARPKPPSSKQLRSKGGM
jgi:hypothetical protein